MHSLLEQFGTYHATSVRGLAHHLLPGSPDPISLRDLLSFRQHVFVCSRELNAGDVAAPDIRLTLFGNGVYALSGHVFDHGSITGDNYRVKATLESAHLTLAIGAGGWAPHQQDTFFDETLIEAKLPALWDEAVAAKVRFHLGQSSFYDSGEIDLDGPEDSSD